MSVNVEPVIVVGGGPTGLTAALELAYHGVASIVLDAGQQRRDGSRAIALHRTALAVWERLGCVEPMLGRGIAWRVRRTFYRHREVSAQLMPAPTPADLPTFLNLQQYYTEDCLIRSVRSTAAIDLRWEHRVVKVIQDEAGVFVDAQAPSGLVRVRGCYVLACDGARSSMRKLLGLDFPGTTYADTFLIADIKVELPMVPEPRFFFDHPTNPGSTILIHPQPEGVWRIDWQLGKGIDIAAECAPDALDRRIRGIVGDISYELLWLSDYRFNQRLMCRIRSDRVFFLGDAAHLVSPFGARGLNSAIHDVENLGWKLAAVLRGEAPEALLDTYQTERWAAQFEDQSVTTATMNFMAPRTVTQKLRRTVVLKLSTVCKPARRWVNSGKMSEPFTYRSSSILVPDGEPRSAWRGAPRPGAKAPDPALILIEAPGVLQPRLVKLRRILGSGFVALYFAPNYTAARLFSDAASAARYPIGLTIWSVLPDVPRFCATPRMLWDYSSELSHAFAAQPGTLFLIRPDGYVAARRRQISVEGLARLMRLASANAQSAVADLRLSPHHVVSGFRAWRPL